jgi:hypothetical protein
MIHSDRCSGVVGKMIVGKMIVGAMVDAVMGGLTTG